MRLRLLVLVSSLCACGSSTRSEVASCDAQSCSGCCNGTRCETGISDATCGHGGAACRACAAALSCSTQGECVTTQVPTVPDAGQPKRIFVTRTAFTGDLKTLGHAPDGPSGADALCDLAAQSMTLGGTWKAWVSTSTELATDRIAEVGPWVDLQGHVVFNNKAGFSTGPLRPIEFDERGTSTVAHFTSGDVQGVAVWTGTTATLTVTRDSLGSHAVRTCLDWASADGAERGGDGTSADSSGGWTEFSSGLVPEGAGNQGDGAASCDSSAHLVCFEQ